MEIKRTKEEITLIEQEMINYITYYKRTALVKLHDQQTSLEICLKGTCSIYCEVYYRLYKVYKKIGTHCVHVASQEKENETRRCNIIKQNKTRRCNIIYISYNAIARSEIQWL